jgi:hypothetical protein
VEIDHSVRPLHLRYGEVAKTLQQEEGSSLLLTIGGENWNPANVELEDVGFEHVRLTRFNRSSALSIKHPPDFLSTARRHTCYQYSHPFRVTRPYFPSRALRLRFSRRGA